MCNPRAPGTTQVHSLGNSPEAQMPEQPREGAREEWGGDLIIFEILGKGGGPKFGKRPWLHAWQAGCLAKKWKLPKNNCKKQKNKKNKGRKTYKSITLLLIIAGSLVFLVPEGFAGNPH